MNRIAFTFALAAGIACASFGYEPQRHNDTFTTNGITYAQRGGLGASDYVVTHVDLSGLATSEEVEEAKSLATTATNLATIAHNNFFYVSQRADEAFIYADRANIYADRAKTLATTAVSMISETNETFSTAVLAVGLNIDTNSVATLNDIADTFGGFPIEGTATTVGGLLAALAAAVAWLKKNKADKSELVAMKKELEIKKDENGLYYYNVEVE